MVDSVAIAEQTVSELQQLLTDNKDVALIQKKLKVLQNNVKVAEIEVEETENAMQRKQLKERISKLNTIVTMTKNQVTTFLFSLESKKRKEIASKREALLGNSLNEAERKQIVKDSSQREMLQKSRNVTMVLGRARNMIEQQVTRIDATRETIAEDNEHLKTVAERSDAITGNLDSANTAVKQLDLQEKRDRMKIYSAILFFFLVVAYIILKRTGMLRMAAAMYATVFSKEST